MHAGLGLTKKEVPGARALHPQDKAHALHPTLHPKEKTGASVPSLQYADENSMFRTLTLALGLHRLQTSPPMPISEQQP